MPATTANLKNNQISKYISRENATILKNVFSATSNGFGKAFYQPKEFTILQDSYAFKFKDNSVPIKKIHSFILASLNKIYSQYNWGNKSGWNKIKKDKIKLPLDANGAINYDFMEEFIAELEATHLAELEAYLEVTGLDNYELTEEEIEAVNNLKNVEYEKYNLEELYGKSSRGKRLKSLDRIKGKLPFVTAGEKNEGVSAFIGNKVEIFNKNTTTIDMFGSAKYRNYNYGADDHVTIVHTEKLPIKASIFVTSAIHCASYTGKFSYSNNFYPKDADSLYIKLPTKDNKPDYEYMEFLISGIQKLVIKDVVKYAKERIKLTEEIVNKNRGQIDYNKYEMTFEEKMYIKKANLVLAEDVEEYKPEN